MKLAWSPASGFIQNNGHLKKKLVQIVKVLIVQ